MGEGKDALARSLGWFSVALGTAQVAAPRRLARLIGVDDDGDTGTVMRAMGVRELATGVGILVRPRPTGWLWARVAGDALDLALLATADSKQRNRVAAAMAAVAGVTVPDIVESIRLSRGDGAGPDAVRRATTINRPLEEVHAAWRDAGSRPRFMANAEIDDERPELIAWTSLGADARPGRGSVRFAPAPGGRGTELVVELRPGRSAQLVDDLRRFKQLLETGDVVRSDASPGGHEAEQHLKQRPAQPLPAGEAAR